MRMRTALILLVTLLATPGIAEAYVGPGAGLSLLAAFWALVAAMGTILMFLVAWPVRRMLRQRKEAQRAEASANVEPHVEREPRT